MSQLHGLVVGNSISTELTADDWSRFAEVEAKQVKLHARLKSQKILSAEEENAINCKTYAEAATFWSQADGEVRKGVWSKNQKGWRLWRRKFQSFSRGVVSFMEDIEPLTDIIQGMGVPFSGLAVGTITTLFTIVARKVDIEEETSSALEGVKDRLPALRMFQEIYGYENQIEADLQKQILFAYLAFINLSMEIINYYIQPGLQRMRTALFSSATFRDLTDEVFSSLSNIDQRRNELLSLGVSKIIATNEQMKHQIEALRLQIDDLQSSRDKEELLDVKNLLGLKSWTLEANRRELHDEYRKRLEYERDDETNYEQMSADRIERFMQNAEFVDWQTQGRSRLLILVGRNNINIDHGKRHNWLSPLALDLLDHIANGAGDVPPHAIYSFSPCVQSRSPRPAGDLAPSSMYTCLSIVLLQLLSSSRQSRSCSSGSDRHVALMAALHTYVQTPPPKDGEDIDNRKSDAIRDVALQIISSREETETFYIILDRVDMCVQQDHHELVRILITMMESAPSVVKILIVADSAGWSLEPKYYGKKACARISQVTMTQGMLYDEGY